MEVVTWIGTHHYQEHIAMHEIKCLYTMHKNDFKKQGMLAMHMPDLETVMFQVPIK